MLGQVLVLRAVEGRGRNGRHPHLRGQPAADGHIPRLGGVQGRGRDVQLPGVRHHEIGALGRRGDEPCLLQDPDQPVPLGLIHGREPVEVALLRGLLEGLGHGFLQGGGHAEGDPLVGHEDGLGQVGRGDGPADLPAGDGEGFPRAAQGDGPLPHAGQAGYAHVLHPVVDHPLVDLVAQHQDVVLLDQPGDGRQLLPAEDLPHRVVGRVQDQEPGPLGEGPGQLVQVQGPFRGLGRPILGAQGHVDRFAPGHGHRGRVAVVEGLDEDDLVPGIQEGLHGGEDGLRGPRSDHEVGQGVQKATEERGVNVSQGLDQARVPGAAGVLVPILGDGLPSRLLDERRRGEVRETLAQIHRAVLVGQRGELREDRGAEVLHPAGRCEGCGRWRSVLP